MLKFKFILTVLISICTFFEVVAQKEAQNWFFGAKAGLTFASGEPVFLLSSNWGTYNASAVQSDRLTGKLLFYSNAEAVWNNENVIMPNGNSLQGNSSISQGCLIVPMPGSPRQYYLFTLTNLNNINPYDNTLSFSIIDMGLDGGRGDITKNQKNLLVDNNLGERLTAIPHVNGMDYWIITHTWDSDIFIIYLLSSSGLKKYKQIKIGSNYGFSRTTSSNMGYLQASPNGKKLASTVFKSIQSNPNLHPLDIFDFDALNGSITNYINLGSFSRQYGICFSPDNSKLYVSHQTISDDSLRIDYLRQYSLDIDDSLAIIKSGKSVVIDNPITNFPQIVNSRGSGNSKANFFTFALQNAPNGRIYGATLGGFCDIENCHQDFPYRFIVINKPNLAGYDCDIRLENIYLGEGSISNSMGLPNFIQNSFNNIVSTKPIYPNCANNAFEIYPNPVKDLLNISYLGDCLESYHIRIINLLGQVLYDIPNQTSRLNIIPINYFPSGLYFIEIIMNDKLQTIKFIKQ